MSVYFRPLVQHGALRAPGAMALAGGPFWFSHAERVSRGGTEGVVPASRIPAETLDRLTAPRAPIAGLELARPHIMGILNTTPDSFSDGGLHADRNAAHAAALSMIDAGAGIIDVGGESTRPGAQQVSHEEERARTRPVIGRLRAASAIPISIDTRKSTVAQAALDAGASMVNDVSGFTFDAALAPLCAARGVPVCVMHAQGDPATMQDRPRYDHVLLDVYDALFQRIEALQRSGIDRSRIVVDPGIGFGKTLEHNLTLLRNISLFHGLGCALLLGVSRKRFIGTIGRAAEASARAPGSIALGLAALDQGVQILRVHDVAETAQAMRLWAALRQGDVDA